MALKGDVDEKLTRLALRRVLSGRVGPGVLGYRPLERERYLGFGSRVVAAGTVRHRKARNLKRNIWEYVHVPLQFVTACKHGN